MQNSIQLIPSGIREELLSFPGPGGMLQGVLSFPPDKLPARGGIVFSHGWSGNRCGPAGLLKLLCRRFAEAGYICLRFDFSGRGESGGSGLETSLTTMGEDLAAAVDCFRKRTGVSAPAVCGLCSGGNVAVGSLNRLPGLAALLLLSVYPFSDGDCFQREVHRTWHFLRIYCQKACCLENWRRLFQGQASSRNVMKVIFGHWLNSGRNREKETGHGHAGGAPGRSARAAGQESRNSRNGQAAPEEHLRKLRPDLPVLMVYGSADPDAEAAVKYFSGYAEKHGLPVHFRTISQANHNFSSRLWRSQLEEMLLEFLKSPEGAESNGAP